MKQQRKPKKQLSLCMCGRPLKVFHYKDEKDQWKEIQGPVVNPKIRKWCNGRCIGIVTEIASLMDELDELDIEEVRSALTIVYKSLLEHLSKRDINGK